jgi:ABC-type phosphate transport system substrate-binding protein
MVGALVLLGASAVWLPGQSADVIVNEAVSVASLDKNALKDVLLGKTAYWEGGQAVVIVLIKGKTDAALQDYSGMSASQFKTHWQRMTFSGRGKQPKEFDDAEKVVGAVAETKGAIALVPAGKALKGAKKLEIK